MGGCRGGTGWPGRWGDRGGTGRPGGAGVEQNSPPRPLGLHNQSALPSRFSARVWSLPCLVNTASWACPAEQSGEEAHSDRPSSGAPSSALWVFPFVHKMPGSRPSPPSLSSSSSSSCCGEGRHLGRTCPGSVWGPVTCPVTVQWFAKNSLCLKMPRLGHAPAPQAEGRTGSEVGGFHQLHFKFCFCPKF